MSSENKVQLITGLVYIIECKDTSIKDFYIGSTLKTYSVRKRRHNYACNNTKSRQHHYKVYKFIRNNGGWNNWFVNVIEYINVEDKEELRIHEQNWMDTLEPTLNSVNAYQYNEKMRTYDRKRDNKVNKIFIKCSNCDKSYTNRRKKAHLDSLYCKNYNVTTSESDSESFIESDTDVE
jgi:hypothetical protein